VIVYKTAAEIEAMRESSRIVAHVLNGLRPMIRPGVRTIELDAYAESRTRELGAKPAFKGYRGYPASLCVSINEGFYGDAARTYSVGAVPEPARRLIEAAERSLDRGLEQLVEGNRISDISAAIQRHVEAHGFSVIRSFVGHGIGRELHEEPQVPNFGVPGRGPKIRRGLVLAIEPMIAAGGWDADIQADGWTAVTKDGSLAAHFEQTVALTDRGVEILSADDGPATRDGRTKEQPYA
jgi:methionyl aminopeptidase